VSGGGSTLELVCDRVLALVLVFVLVWGLGRELVLVLLSVLALVIVWGSDLGLELVFE
jgi:hypothetical protein